MATLTRARRALWDCIDTWHELRQAGDPSKSIFRLKMRWNEDQPLMADFEPSLSDFPTIEILPAGAISASWDTNVAQSWPYALEIRVWVQGWSLPELEDLAEKVGRAIFQATPEGSTVSYVKNAIGLYPQIGGFTITPVKIQDGSDDEDAVTATRLSLQVLLPAKFNPFGA